MKKNPKEEFLLSNYRGLYNMPGASVVIGERYLMYAAINTNMLVKFDLHHKMIDKIFYIPHMYTGNKYIYKMYAQNNKIYMLPFEGGKVGCFDAEEEKFCDLYEDKLFESEKNVGVRTSVFDGRNIWSVESTRKQIYKWDVKEGGRLKVNLPTNSNEVSLGQAILYKGCIYVLSRNDEPGIKINVESGIAEEWEAGRNIWYGCIYEDYLYYTSYHTNIGGIYRKHINSCHVEEVKRIEDDRAIDMYRYWRPRIYGDKIFFLPYETDMVMVYNVHSNNLYYVSPYDSSAMNFSINKYKMVYDIVQWGEKYIIMPGRGNQIVIMSSKFDVEQRFEQPLPIERCLEQERERGYILEKEGFSIEDMLEYRGMFGKDKKNMIESNGQKIHKIMCNS